MQARDRRVVGLAMSHQRWNDLRASNIVRNLLVFETCLEIPTMWVRTSAEFRQVLICETHDQYGHLARHHGKPNSPSKPLKLFSLKVALVNSVHNVPTVSNTPTALILIVHTFLSGLKGLVDRPLVFPFYKSIRSFLRIEL